MNKNIIWPIFISLWALLYSLFEIEIEGKYGWAQKLPVLKLVKPNSFFPLGLTSWNILMIILVVLSIFNPLIFAKIFKINLPNEYIYLFIVSFLMWTLIEDQMWFAYNPSYNKKNNIIDYQYSRYQQYNQENITWHKFNSFGIPNIIPLIIFFVILTIAISQQYPSNNISYKTQMITYLMVNLILIYLGKFYCIWLGTKKIII